MTFSYKKHVLMTFVIASLVAAACKTTQTKPPVTTPPVVSAPAPVEPMPEDVRSMREKALAAQNEARTLKADKAVKDEFAHASDIFLQGEAAADGKNWPGANDMYVKALDEFAEVIKIAADKRRLAELAYEDASEAILEARRRALETEVKLGDKLEQDGEPTPD